MALSLSIIAPLGETALEDYLIPKGGESFANIYPIGVKRAHAPCFNSELGVLDHCGGKRKCSCKNVEEYFPTWFEIDRNQLRAQMRRACDDILLFKSHKNDTHQLRNHGMKFCWFSLRDIHYQRIGNLVCSENRKLISVPVEYHLDVPSEYHHSRGSQNASLAMSLILISIFC